MPRRESAANSGFCHSGCSWSTTRSTTSLEGIRQIVRRDTILEQERHDRNPLRADVAEVGTARRELRQHPHLSRLRHVQQPLTDHVGDEKAPASVRLDTVDSANVFVRRSEEHTSELQSQSNLVCRLLLEKKTLHD